MPRKTDGIPFEVHRSPKADEEGNVMLYAVPQSNRTKDFKELETWELQRSFDAFMDECTRWLSQGYRVQTPIGVFSLKLGMKRKVTNPREVRHDDVEFKGIEFRPSAEFTKGVKVGVESEGFRYVSKADSTLLAANEDAMLKALYKSIQAEGGYTTVTRFMSYSGLSKYAATRKLHQWCQSGSCLLRERRLGHSIIYELIDP